VENRSLLTYQITDNTPLEVRSNSLSYTGIGDPAHTPLYYWYTLPEPFQCPVDGDMASTLAERKRCVRMASNSLAGVCARALCGPDAQNARQTGNSARTGSVAGAVTLRNTNHAGAVALVAAVDVYVAAIGADEPRVACVVGVRRARPVGSTG